MKDVFEYDVFLSFAGVDEELVKPLWQEMSLSGLRVFWADETLKQNIGQSFFEVIEKALEQSRHFVLFCTSNAMQSDWVKLEYQTFFSLYYLKSGGLRRLVLYQTKGFGITDLPPFLRNIQIANSTNQIISQLGGVDIQALKARNRELERKIVTMTVDLENAKARLKEEKLNVSGRDQAKDEEVRHILEAKTKLEEEIERLKKAEKSATAQEQVLKSEIERIAGDKAELEKRVKETKAENDRLKTVKPEACDIPVNLTSQTQIETFDVLGRVAPYPLVLVKKKLTKMSSGQVVKVLCDSPHDAEDSIPKYIKKSGHEFNSVYNKDKKHWELYIKK